MYNTTSEMGGTIKEFGGMYYTYLKESEVTPEAIVESFILPDNSRVQSLFNARKYIHEKYNIDLMATYGNKITKKSIYEFYLYSTHILTTLAIALHSARKSVPPICNLNDVVKTLELEFTDAEYNSKNTSALIQLEQTLLPEIIELEKTIYLAAGKAVMPDILKSHQR